MDRDIKQFFRECVDCQQSKIIRHTKSEVQHFSLPSERFQTVHIDIIGPLPPVKNIENPYISPYRYALTCVDRATRWVEAAPLTEITAASVATAFFNTWISRLGVPLHLISDRGSQFESELFAELSKIIGFHRLRTSSYHPETNSLIERVHRTLKTAIIARKESWLSAMNVVLFGMRIVPNDSGYSPFTAMTGADILIPQLLLSNDEPSFNSECIEKLAKEMTRLNVDKLSRGKFKTPKKSFIPKELANCEEIWLRVDRIRRSMEAPYTGPYKVLHRTDKNITIQLNNGSIN